MRRKIPTERASARILEARGSPPKPAVVYWRQTYTPAAAGARGGESAVPDLSPGISFAISMAIWIVGIYLIKKIGDWNPGGRDESR
jgi:hypothetical protein